MRYITRKVGAAEMVRNHRHLTLGELDRSRRGNPVHITELMFEYTVLHVVLNEKEKNELIAALKKKWEVVHKEY